MPSDHIAKARHEPPAANWDTMPFSSLNEQFMRDRPTPASVVESIVYCVRERGIEALDEPVNIKRLSRCDATALKTINERIERLIAAGKVLS